MKHNTLMKLFAIGMGMATLYGCGGDPAFSVNTLQLGNGIGDNFTASTLEINDGAVTGTSDIDVHVVDDDGLLSNEPITVTFTSACIVTGDSTVTPASVQNTNGIISTTYTNISCTSDDDVVATTNTSPLLTATGVVQATTGTTTVITQDELAIGSFSSGTFTAGSLSASATTLQPGGSTLITVDIVDNQNQFSSEPMDITFSSPCVAFGFAGFDQSTVSNTNGSITVQFTDNNSGCAATTVLASATLTDPNTTKTLAVGGTVATVGLTISATAPAPAGTLSIGNGIGSGFDNGTLNIQSQSLLTGGSTLITANIVDENSLLDTTNSNTVNFQILCDNLGTYTLSDTSVTNSTGVFSTTFTDVSCNGTVNIAAYATLNGETKIASDSLSIGTASPTEEVYSIGELTGGGFVAGQMNLSSTSLNAGESSLITVHVADSAGNLYTSADTDVIFNSTCVGQGTATIDVGDGTSSTSTTTTGTATATYQATGCIGGDTVTATASGLNGTTTASGTITVVAAAFNTIEFVSATPTQIGIQGMGLNETTNVKFKLVDESNGPVEGQTVNFTLSNSAGGITLTNASAVSGADGEVTAVVQSGKVQANFVVTASTVVGATTYVASSNTISVQDAIPAQNGLSLVASSLNPEGYNKVATVAITAYVNDRNNNPVPDGNRVNFLAECGNIGGSCETTSGSCSVDWVTTPINCTAYNDATDLGKVSIMAYIDGEESFLDADANGEFGAGDTVLTNNDEAYMDFDNSGGFNGANDAYQDFNGNGSHDNAAALGTGFNGALCVSNCGTTDRVHVYKSTTLIASASGAAVTFSVGSVAATASTTTNFTFTVKDSNGNIMPAGTKINISASTGQIATSASYVVNNGNPISAGEITTATTYSSTFISGTAGDAGLITLKVEAPSGTTSYYYLSIQ